MPTRIEGRERLLRQMRALGPETRSAIKQALAQGADEIVSLAKQLAPSKTGALRNSIQSNFGDKPAGPSGMLSAGGAIAGDPDLTVWITAGNAEAYYARWVEFGTAPHIVGGKFAGAQHPGSPGQPFFYPAYRAQKRRVKSRITRAVKAAARKAAAR